jgi:hypothetical protein
MKEPWTIGELGRVVLVEPEVWLFDSGRWDLVEAALGTRLPTDYKDVIGDGLACVFDDELWIASPFDSNINLNLMWEVARSAWTLAYLRHEDSQSYAISIYPEPGGLLGWGADGGGGMYHWDTTDADPDRWTVAVSGRPVYDPYVQDQARGLTAYLSALASGEIEAAALSSWPSAGARIERRAP